MALFFNPFLYTILVITTSPYGR